MVEISQLNKSYGKLPVLNDVTLRFDAGTITAVVGPNASGKTTLLKCLLGLAVPDRGGIRVAGRPIDANAWDYRRLLSYMPQTPRFPETLTLHEVLRLVTDVRGEPAPFAAELIPYFQLDAYAAKPVGRLSVGTRQKINAVTALMFDTAVIVADEPTASLDPLASSRLKDLLRGRRAAGKCVIVTSHHLAELEGFVDRVAFLLEGSLRFVGSVAEICTLTGEASVERAVAKLMLERAA